MKKQPPPFYEGTPAIRSMVYHFCPKVTSQRDLPCEITVKLTFENFWQHRSEVQWPGPSQLVSGAAKSSQMSALHFCLDGKIRCKLNFENFEVFSSCKLMCSPQFSKDRSRVIFPSYILLRAGIWDILAASAAGCVCNCNTLKHTATHCNTLQHTATHCNTLQHTATPCSTLQRTTTQCQPRWSTAAHCNQLQHIATHCNTLQHIATKCNKMRQTVLHCSTLHYTALHCNTPL